MDRAIGKWALLCCAVFFGACKKAESLPQPPDHAASQQALWQLAAADTELAVTVVDAGHLLDRLKAFDAVLESGPATKAKLQPLRTAAQARFGFDLFDRAGWKQRGIDLDGPVALFVRGSSSFQVVFRPADAAAAKSLMTNLAGQSAGDSPVECASIAKLLHCGTVDWKLAEDAAHSLWPHVEANVPVARRGLEVMVYAPLDRGSALDKLAAQASQLRGHAAYAGMHLTPERFQVRMGVRADDVKAVMPYLEARPGESNLGLAAGGIAGSRFTFSPDALWSRAKAQAPEQVSSALGAVQAATGLDLEKDLVENLTGEIVIASYRSDTKADKDGKHRSLRERTGHAMIAGMRDDTRTRHLVERLGGVIGGAVGAYGELAAKWVKVSFRTDPGDRPAHWLTAELGADAQKLVGFDRVELSLTSVPGGLALCSGQSGLEELRKRVGQKPAAFLDKLPLPEEREAFLHSPFVTWTKAGDGFGARLEQAKAMTGLDEFLPGAQQIMLELTSIGQLLFDAMMSVDVTSDRAELFYQVTFL